MSKTQLFDLDGKIAFVSGASRGIGEAIAKLLAQQGAHVIVSSRKLEGCQHVADAIIAAGGKATAIACHIGEMEQISQVFAGIREQFGRSEEHTSELQSLMRISYAVFCLKKKNKPYHHNTTTTCKL